jgi:hypothetical protein
MPKMLLLAGTDRLDKPLTIGQMQVCVFGGGALLAGYNFRARTQP